MGCRKSEQDEQRKESRVRLNPDSVLRSICQKSPIFRERALYFRTRDVEERESCTLCARFCVEVCLSKKPHFPVKVFYMSIKEQRASEVSRGK